MAFKSRHNLKFEAYKWDFGLAGSAYNFRIGTCGGLYSFNKTAYIIIAIENKQKGNGHFEDVLEWFYESCKRDKMDLIIAEIWNARLYRHLVIKRGFKDISLPESDGQNVVKSYK